MATTTESKGGNIKTDAAAIKKLDSLLTGAGRLMKLLSNAMMKMENKEDQSEHCEAHTKK